MHKPVSTPLVVNQMLSVVHHIEARDSHTSHAAQKHSLTLQMTQMPNNMSVTIAGDIRKLNAALKTLLMLSHLYPGNCQLVKR